MKDERPELTLIAALSKNFVIGRAGELPWHIPGDLAFFKRTTMGHAIIMGRKTYDSVGKALPGRRNIVVTRQEGLAIEGCEVVHSLEAAIKLAREGGDQNPHIVGGESIYRLAMPLATRLVLTEVDQHIEDGDTFFPSFDRNAWTESARDAYEGYAFTLLKRR